MKKYALISWFLVLTILSPAQADWCDGKRYDLGPFKLGEMGLADRLQSGQQALRGEIEALRQAAATLEFETRAHWRELLQDVNHNQQQLEAGTRALCRDAKIQGFQSATFEGIALEGAEITAQLRMNLASLRANRAVLHALEKEQQGIAQAAAELRRHADGLAVLEKHFDALLDPRRDARDPGMVLRNACVTLRESRRLRTATLAKTPDELFAAAAGRHPVSSITEADLSRFKADCTLSSGGEDFTLSPQAPWYRFW